MIEKDFDIAFIADLAVREKQIQQNYRPVIAVHKWFARRPGTLFRGLLLSEFAKNSLQDAFYNSNKFNGIHIADPFMGGGTPILEANRVGCDVTGIDINPMAWWIVKQEIEHLDINKYVKAAKYLREALEKDVGYFYKTHCNFCNSNDAHVKYFLWVKVKTCEKCGEDIDLFPGYLIASDSRHPKNVFVCPECGELTETINRNSPGKCACCNTALELNGPAKRGQCRCPTCNSNNKFPANESSPLNHRLFAIEYHCPRCKPAHKGRFYKKPDLQDIERVRKTEVTWAKMVKQYVPDDEIPSGDETDRLHRWGYRRYSEMFNKRQLVGLELSARHIMQVEDEPIRNALATNISDLLRYQNMLCRYDTSALKSLDIFSVHGFPVGLIQCESNLLGILPPGQNTCVGSGGWANIIEKFKKAKTYCNNPFEVRYIGGRKKIIPIHKEWIGDHYNGSNADNIRRVNIFCEDASSSDLPDNSIDAVLTDPPYFGNVQYAELMDFCYVWLKKLVGHTSRAFDNDSTRSRDELTGNITMGRDLKHFTEGLSATFHRMSHAMKSGAPFAFTYHHNKIKAYYPVAVAILDAGLTCSASLPCPAEMGASIHINGTGSSIIDTVFVCRSTGTMQKKWLADTPEEVAKIVEKDLALLKAGNVNPTSGDIRCITFGHLIRLAIWSLRSDWEVNIPTDNRLSKIENWLQKFGGPQEVEKLIEISNIANSKDLPLFSAHEKVAESGAEYGDISF